MESKSAPDVYRAIPGFHKYLAGADGSIISKRSGRPLCQLRTGKYLQVVLCEGEHHRIGVHVAIAAAWYGPRPDGMVVNHKNGNRHDNRPENLEWVTQSENVQHAYRMGLRQIDTAHRERCAGLGRAKRKTSNVTDAAVRNAFTGKRGDITRIAGLFGISRDIVQRIINENRETPCR